MIEHFTDICRRLVSDKVQIVNNVSGLKIKMQLRLKKIPLALIITVSASLELQYVFIEFELQQCGYCSAEQRPAHQFVAKAIS